MMTDAEIDRLADSWLAEWEAGQPLYTDFEHPTANDKVSDLRFDNHHETVWKFILAAYPRDMSRRVFSILAAGPLEDLLVDFGALYIDRVEVLARQDPKFNDLLGGVWKNAITDEVWERVTTIRNNVW